MAMSLQDMNKKSAKVIKFPNKKIDTELDEISAKAFELMDQDKWRHTAFEDCIGSTDSIFKSRK
ncbi:hypothetical protein [Cytobacillus sp. IB215665]|uniref:hypothetical protein n=1 Tax=Cytobacillus sp. IB215665 TaxID=3097357 RepID=UPI002A116505|nr:hypothetical protein [Cytobacillus sp. IB215665]MDX8367881.1 hypothetical protein [Cytobacillus sp. IB215665]